MKIPSRLILSCFIFSLLFSTTLFISSTEARNYLLTTQSSITIEVDISNFGVVTPGREVSTNITIIYEYGRLARPEGFPFPKKRMPTTINLTIESIPEWCSIKLDQGRFEVPVDTFLLDKSRTINLSVQLTARIDSLSAPAFERGTIRLNATAKQNGNILPSSVEYDIVIEPQFIPAIDVNIINRTIDLKPNGTKIFNVFIKNQGNARIIASLDYNKTDLEYLDISIPEEKPIDINEEITFPITIKAKKPGKEVDVTENIKFSISYHAFSDSTLEGRTLYLTIFANIEGEKTDSISIDFAPIIAVIAIILIVALLLIIYVFYVKRRR